MPSSSAPVKLQRRHPGGQIGQRSFVKLTVRCISVAWLPWLWQLVTKAERHQCGADPFGYLDRQRRQVLRPDVFERFGTAPTIRLLQIRMDGRWYYRLPTGPNDLDYLP